MVYVHSLFKSIQIFLGLSCVVINIQCFLDLESISTGYELLFHITVAAFLIGTIIFEFSTTTIDGRIFDGIAAISLLVASCGLLAIINENDALGKYWAERKALNDIKYIKIELTYLDSLSAVFNKYTQFNVYGKYTIAGIIGILNGFMYVPTALSSKLNGNHGHAFVMHNWLRPHQRDVIYTLDY